MLITECTFGLPIYRWPDPAAVAEEINSWWSNNAAEGRTTVLYAYALGKAQRVLSLLDPSIGPIYTHGAVENMTENYRAEGVDLPPTIYATDKTDHDYTGGLVLAPTSAGRGCTASRRSALATCVATRGAPKPCA